MFKSKNNIKIIVFVAFFFAVMIATAIYKFTRPLADNLSRNETVIGNNQSQKNNAPKETTIEIGPPEISGWIAWWKEADGYAVVDKNKENLASVSPGWLKLDKKGNLVETGKVNKILKSAKMRQAGLKLFPMLTTDMIDKELADFAKNEKNLQGFLENLIVKLKNYQADGLDLDFEDIGSLYSSDFSFLVKNISEELKKQNLKFSLTIQAQTGKEDWDGLRGQDLSFLPQYADEVRIMAYDRHGEFSEPGPITPMDWYADVINYNLKFIPREKIVIGLPTYGYIWQENGIFQSFQFKEFISYAKNKNFKTSRNPESFELEYANKSAAGWLSDSASVIKKIEYARKTGLNRFVIWNLGGTDEELFQKRWESLTLKQSL